MKRLAQALIVTAVTLAGWLYVVRVWERSPGQVCRVSYVYDGDTVALRCGGDDEVTARVQGLDTPETRDAQCDAELAVGKQATQRLRQLVKSGEVGLRKLGTDKYGRWLIRLTIDGRDVARTLIGEGLAVNYQGGARINWCKRLAQ